MACALLFWLIRICLRYSRLQWPTLPEQGLVPVWLMGQRGLPWARSQAVSGQTRCLPSPVGWGCGCIDLQGALPALSPERPSSVRGMAVRLDSYLSVWDCWARRSSVLELQGSVAGTVGALVCVVIPPPSQGRSCSGLALARLGLLAGCVRAGVALEEWLPTEVSWMGCVCR